MLFVLPGKLPRDYLEGKRARFVSPLKLYFVMIAIAFTIVQLMGWDLGLSLGTDRFNLFHVPRSGVAEDPSNMLTSHWVLKHVDTPGIRRFKALSLEEQLKVRRQRGIRYVPDMALGLVFVFAALLQWVYRTRHLRYGAHLVFGLYTHSFLLLTFVIEAKLPAVLATILTIWAVVYYAFALKCTNGGTWSETIGRGALLAGMYILTFLFLGLLVTALLLSI